MKPALTLGWSFVFGTVVAAAACGGTSRGATDVNLAKARDVSAQGASAFSRECAGCHGARGEGSSAPAIIGAGALPEFPRERDSNTNPASSDPELMRAQAQTRPAGAPWRDPFRTALDLFTFVSTRMPMPKDKIGTLKPEEYWSITSFMLVAHGSAVPAGGVTPENAASVKIAPQ